MVGELHYKELLIGDWGTWEERGKQQNQKYINFGGLELATITEKKTSELQNRVLWKCFLVINNGQENTRLEITMENRE